MAEIKDPENTILMELKDGTVTIELLPDIAPLHCARMKELARAGAYDNVAFHRVIEGFMAQTGDVQHANMEKDYNPRMAGTGSRSDRDDRIGSENSTLAGNAQDIIFTITSIRFKKIHYINILTF